jgi:GTPase SAR1 family protein
MFVINVALVGNSGVGKTTYVNRLVSAEFLRPHVPTIGYTDHLIDFNFADESDKGRRDVVKTVFVVRDFGDNPNPDDFLGIDAAIYLCDISNRESANSLEWYTNNIKKVCGDIPFICCLNKVDILGTSRRPWRDVLPKSHILLSSKSNFNFEKPFATVAQQVFNNMNLKSVAVLDE